MGNSNNEQVTCGQEVIEMFESSFADKVEIAIELESMWLKRALAKYALEIEPLNYDENEMSFTEKLPIGIIATLAMYMRQFYQEREVSRINKQISIVGRDISIDGKGVTKNAAKNELEYWAEQNGINTFHNKPTAYS